MIMQAIEAKYRGPTDTKGSRIVVSAQAGRKVYAWQHSLSTEDNYLSAARRYCEALGWSNDLHMGCLGDGHYVFVQVAPVAS